MDMNLSIADCVVLLSQDIRINCAVTLNVIATQSSQPPSRATSLSLN